MGQTPRSATRFEQCRTGFALQRAFISGNFEQRQHLHRNHRIVIFGLIVARLTLAVNAGEIFVLLRRCHRKLAAELF